MRLLLAAAFAALAAPVAAQDTLADQVAAARQIYMSGLPADIYREGGYFRVLADGLDGSYVELSAMIDQADAAGIRRQQDAFCARNPFVVTVTPPFGIFITRGADEKIQYTHTGGATFMPALDVIGYARANPGARGSAAHDLLRRVAEPVSIWRPSADVFVITGRDVPDVFVRCPRGAVPGPLAPLPGADAGNAALAEALGATFDQQFGTGKPIGRQAFIACTAPVFAAFAPEDLALVIDTEFSPPQAARERIEAEHPGLQEALAACAEAAEAATE